MQSKFPRGASFSQNANVYMPDYAITHNLTPFISMQNHYNLLYREEEREMFPTLKVRISDITYKTWRADTMHSTSVLLLSLGRRWLEGD